MKDGSICRANQGEQENKEGEAMKYLYKTGFIILSLVLSSCSADFHQRMRDNFEIERNPGAKYKEGGVYERECYGLYREYSCSQIKSLYQDVMYSSLDEDRVIRRVLSKLAKAKGCAGFSESINSRFRDDYIRSGRYKRGLYRY